MQLGLNFFQTFWTRLTLWILFVHSVHLLRVTSKAIKLQMQLYLLYHHPTQFHNAV